MTRTLEVAQMRGYILTMDMGGSLPAATAAAPLT